MTQPRLCLVDPNEIDSQNKSIIASSSFHESDSKIKPIGNKTKIDFKFLRANALLLHLSNYLVVVFENSYICKLKSYDYTYYE